MVPFCFMVMPFGRKATAAEPGKGPAEIDFNALWDKAYFPLLKELGYQPVRADQETGSLIINQMLERLYFSDLVLADLTIPNGNVYYEIGVRHAARETGCILLAADWSKQLFDVAQMRSVRYPLPQGEVDEGMARAIQEAIRPHIERMGAARSPVFDVLPGYPGPVDESKATGVRDQIEALAAFQGQVQALRSLPAGMRKGEVGKLVARYGARSTVPTVAVGLLRLLVSCVETSDDWQGVLDVIEKLDPELAKEPYIREQRALALGKVARPIDAIAELQTLIRTAGASSEREGLLGGRYKELMRIAQKSGRAQEAKYFLGQSIEHYERGMMLDLNDFFPASNLPRLYRQRGESSDESKAQMALHVTSAACERAISRGTVDEWVRPTLLGVAFDLGDVDKAEELTRMIEREGADAWKLETTLASLKDSAAQGQDPKGKARLHDVLARLTRVLSPGQ
jgi:hypothetical protein